MGLAQPEETARQIKLLLEGCLSLTLIHGDPSYARSAAAAAKAVVEWTRRDEGFRSQRPA